ncbi:hypothetical protein ACU4GD_25095 [Cupriavidus basilensis]
MWPCAGRPWHLPPAIAGAPQIYRMLPAGKKAVQPSVTFKRSYNVSLAFA